MEIAIEGLRVLWGLLLPILAVALAAGLLAGFVRAATRIEDGALNFSVKLAAVAALLYFSAGRIGDSLTELARQSWTSL